MSESTAHYIVTKIEKILIQEPQFHLKTLKHAIPIEDTNNRLLAKLLYTTES